MTRPDPHSVGRLWVEEGETQSGPTATVAPVGPVDKTLTYAVPPDLAERLAVGQRVHVRLGKRSRPTEAFCVELGHDEWRHTLRPIESLVDDESYLSADLLELGRWMAEYYCCPLGITLAALVPAAVRRKSGFVNVRRARLRRPRDEILAQRIGPRSAALVDALTEADTALDVDVLLERAHTTAGTLRAAVNKGWIETVTERRPKPPPEWGGPRNEPTFELNSAQLEAVRRLTAKLDAGAFSVTLLYGVSGSGKTEVYVRAMRRALAAGRQTIMLVPEIALTTQLVQRLASRFDDVAVLHSGLTSVERSLTWQAIARGERAVVIGTRSAVFAPCRRLGLIVVDEEQEPSYKNLQAPRFHVRDVAIKRAQMCDIPILLGSATPSLETWANCTRFAHYERIELPARVGDLPMPEVEIVDMRRTATPRRVAGPRARQQADWGLGRADTPALSPVTLRVIGAAFDRGEQTVVLVNRRGYAGVVSCPSCGWRLCCPHCNVGMVFHLPRGEATCHYCRTRVNLPALCPDPSCGTALIRARAGTQRVQEELTAAFPTARIARADSDTMKRGADYQELVDRFEARQIDILTGTQMIGKGLDFPNVSTVAVIGAEPVGAAADFRSSERLFQLITQVAGRAGRAGPGGRVVVQTLTPEAVSVQAAVDHDYERFAQSELDIRRRVGFPPFTRLARFLFAHPRAREAREIARSFAAALRQHLADLAASDADVLGPQPCALERLRNRYRYDVLLRARRVESLHSIIYRMRTEGPHRPRVDSFIVDVDPVDLG